MQIELMTVSEGMSVRRKDMDAQMTKLGWDGLVFLLLLVFFAYRYLRGGWGLGLLRAS